MCPQSTSQGILPTKSERWLRLIDNALNRCRLVDMPRDIVGSRFSVSLENVADDPGLVCQKLDLTKHCHPSQSRPLADCPVPEIIALYSSTSQAAVACVIPISLDEAPADDLDMR